MKDAITAAGISGGYSSNQIIKRIVTAIEHETPHSADKLSAALDDLAIAGGAAEANIIQRIRDSLDGEDEDGLRKALDDLMNGGGSYTASAVHFDGSTYLSIATGPAIDSRYFSCSQWRKVDSLALPTLNKSPFVALDTFGDGLVDYAANHQENGSLTGEFSDTGDFINALYPDYPSGTFPSDEWVHLLWTVDMGSAPKLMTLYVNDAFVTPSGQISDGDPTTISWNKSIHFEFLPGPASPTPPDYITKGDMADSFFMPGVNLESSGTIPEATRRLFIDANGKPVDPVVAIAELGTPSFLFSGDSTSYATNQGNGGAVTLTGILTNASTSPSD